MNAHRRTILVSAAAVLVAIGTVAMASSVTIPKTLVAGTTIVAADLNANFNALAVSVNDNDARINQLITRVSALEAAAADHPSYYVGQGGVDANANVDDLWIDVPGMAIPATFAQTTNIRYSVFGRIYSWAGGAGTTNSCSVRIVIDDNNTPLNGSFPENLGDWTGLLSNDNDADQNHQVALGGLKTLPTGSYNFKLQIVRAAKIPASTGNCSFFRWSFSRAQMFIDVVP